MRLEERFIFIIRIHPLGTTDIYAKCHASPTNSWKHLSLKTKNGNLQVMLEGKLLDCQCQ